MTPSMVNNRRATLLTKQILPHEISRTQHCNDKEEEKYTRYASETFTHYHSSAMVEKFVAAAATEST